MALKEVRYAKKIKRISLQRYLISKIVHEAEKVGPSDILCLYDNQIWLEKKCLSDFDFSKKFEKSLEEISFLLKEINLSQGLSRQAVLRLSQKLKFQLEQFILPQRNYPAFKTRFSGLFSLVAAEQPGKPNKQIPPKRLIGVGYRDKGNLPNLATDGSPSWQEVASHEGQLKMTIVRIENAKTFEELRRAFCDYFQINPREGGS